MKYGRGRVATGRSLVIQRSNRLFIGMGLPELAEEVVPSQSKTHDT